jgi:hypothetical protein
MILCYTEGVFAAAGFRRAVIVLEYPIFQQGWNALLLFSSPN